MNGGIPVVPKPTCPTTTVEEGGKSGYEDKRLWHPSLPTGRKRAKFLITSINN